jgi:hypothetical protein
MIAAALALVLAGAMPARQAAPAAKPRQAIVGGHRFVVTHSVRKKHAAAEGVNLPPELRLDRTLVQIDRPHGPSERAWNQAMQRWLREGETLAFPGEDEGGFRTAEGPGQVEVEVSLVSASPELIVSTLGVSTYFGGAHPNYVSRAMLWSVPLARPLRNGEILSDPANPGLARLVVRKFDRDSQGCEAPKLANAKLTADANGIAFDFDPYELGGYPCGGTSRLSWAEAAPFLRAKLPFDRSKLANPDARLTRP